MENLRFNTDEFDSAMNGFYYQLDLSEPELIEFIDTSIPHLAKLTNVSVGDLASEFGRSSNYFKTTYYAYCDRRKEGKNTDSNFNSLNDKFNHLVKLIHRDDDKTESALWANLYANYTNLELPKRYQMAFSIDVASKPIARKVTTAKPKPEVKTSTITVRNIANGKTIEAEGVPDGFINFYKKLHDALNLDSPIEFIAKPKTRTITW